MLILPKQYLSYSAIDLWERDSERYRLRYYENQPPLDTPYTRFGKEVHEQIETDDKYKAIRLPVAEYQIEVDISGVPIKGYIDTFDPNTFQFGEYKTGINQKNGTSRWNQAKVDNHRQLSFYSLCIYEKFKVKIDHTFLVHLTTEWEEISETKGNTKIVFEKNLKLSGEWKIYDRIITEQDRNNTREWIISNAQEISEDYEKYRKTKN